MNQVQARSEWAIAQNYQQNSFKTGQMTVQVISPQKATGICIFGLYGRFIGTILDRIKETALEKIKNPNLGFFRISNRAIQAEIMQRIAEASNIEEEKGTKKALAVTSLTGLSIEECSRCIQLTHKFAQQFFKNFELLLPYSTTPEEIDQWQKEQTVSALNHLYRSLGMTQSEEPVSFTDEDLLAFQIERDQIKSDPKLLTCQAYAFLKARVLQAKDLIFEKGGDDRLMRGILTLLPSWGYEPVETPEAGDLVVYLKNDKPDHVGVYMGKDRVHSKIGILNSHSHTHRLFSVENKAVFFRKKD